MDWKFTKPKVLKPWPGLGWEISFDCTIDIVFNFDLLYNGYEILKLFFYVDKTFISAEERLDT